MKLRKEKILVFVLTFAFIAGGSVALAPLARNAWRSITLADERDEIRRTIDELKAARDEIREAREAIRSFTETARGVEQKVKSITNLTPGRAIAPGFTEKLDRRFYPRESTDRKPTN